MRYIDIKFHSEEAFAKKRAKGLYLEGEKT
jgi:hypothetical protein